MKFKVFLELVPKLPKVELPGAEAHYKMATAERIEQFKKLDLKNVIAKNAAVMMFFYPKNGLVHLALILRTSYNGAHSSQVAFPGGKYEIDDITFDVTALRETHEEIGIQAKQIEIIMPFTNIYVHPSNFMVYPFLGICKDEVVFKPDKNEVSDIIELPLHDLLNEKLVVKTTISTAYIKDIEIPAFKINEHIVWGATAMMLNELKEVLKKVI